MALIKCPDCGKEVSDRGQSCPVCGFPIQEEVVRLAQQAWADDKIKEIEEQGYNEDDLMQLIGESSETDRIEQILHIIDKYNPTSIKAKIYRWAQNEADNLVDTFDVYRVNETIMHGWKTIDEIYPIYPEFEQVDIFRNMDGCFRGIVREHADKQPWIVSAEGAEELKASLAKSYEFWKESTSASKRYLIKIKGKVGFTTYIHIGDLGYLWTTDVEKMVVDQVELARRQLNLVASQLTFDSNPSRPMSIGGSALTGAIIGGIPGAIVGAAIGLEKESSYQKAIRNRELNEQKRMEAEAALKNVPLKKVTKKRYWFNIKILAGNICFYLDEDDEVAIEYGRQSYSVQELWNLLKNNPLSNSRIEARSIFSETGSYQTAKEIEDVEMKQMEERLLPARNICNMVKHRLQVGPNQKSPLQAGIDVCGKVYISHDEEFRKDMEAWTFISKLSIGEVHAIGLTFSGTVMASGNNRYGQCDVDKWQDIVDIVVGGWHSIGLKKDGTVVATGYNDYGQCNVSEWNNIVKIAAGKNHTVGLKSDGTVVATGLQEDRRCKVDHWKNIVDVYAYNGYTVGITADRTVETTCDNSASFAQWENIVDVALGIGEVVGLTSDGIVYSACTAFGQSSIGDTSSWENIVAISCFNMHIVGLRADGTVVATGSNDSGQCNIQSWKDIVAVSAGKFHTLGLKKDGTVLCTGRGNTYQYTKTNQWKLFDNIDTYEEELKIAIQKEAEYQEAERKRLAEIKQHNALINKQIAEADKQLKEQILIYTQNERKILGEGAKLKRSAKSEMARLETLIDNLKQQLK